MYVCYVYGMCSCVWCICVASMCDVYMCVWSVWWLHCVCVCVSMWCVVLSLFFQLRWRIRSSPWDNRDIGGEAIIFQTLKKPPPNSSSYETSSLHGELHMDLSFIFLNFMQFSKHGFSVFEKESSLRDQCARETSAMPALSSLSTQCWETSSTVPSPSSFSYQQWVTSYLLAR